MNKECKMKALLKEIKEWKQGWLKYLVYSYKSTLYLYSDRWRRFRLFFKRKKSLLTALVKEERKKIYRKKPFTDRFLIDLYTPSIRSFFYIFGVFILFFLLAHWSQNLLPEKWRAILLFADLESNYYQNLITIITGIGTIVFALTIFVAESFREGSTDRGRVLLRESYIWPLTVSVVLSFLILIWGGVNIIIVVPIIAIAFLTIFSFAQIINTLLSRYRFAKKREQLLVENLQKSIDLAINERVANNVLLSKLDGKKIKLKFYPFSFEKKSNLICFKARRLGVIEDINIEKLAEFADYLEDKANVNGFAFDEIERKSIEVASEGVISAEAESKKLKRNRQRYLVRKFHDVLDEEHNTLICFDKNLIKGDDKARRDLQDIFDQIFTIGKIDNFTEEIRYEISNAKDQFTTAILNSRTGEIKELAKLYIGLGEGFLEQMLLYGGGYTAEQAHTIFADWPQVQWLSLDIRDLLKQAVKSHNQEVIREVAYIPIAIARRAIEKNDHYLFEEFIGFAEILYMHALQEDNKALRKFMVDRSWRYIKEIADVYVEFKLNQEELSKEEEQSLKDFAIYFLMTFQNLIKRAFDKKNFDDFQEFKNVAVKLFDHFRPGETTHNAQMLEWQLKNSDLTEDQRANLSTLFETQKRREQIEKEISNRKKQMLFGLASWIFDYLYHHKADEDAKKFFTEIQNALSSNLEEFTDIFLQSHSFEVEDFWNWDWWEIYPDGEVHSIQTLEKLERLYVVRALNLLSGKTEDEIKKIKLRPNRDLAYLADGVRDLMNTLNDIEKNPTNWEFVLNTSAIGKVSNFKELLQDAKKRQEQEELELKRTKLISANRVEEFKSDVITSFNKVAKIQDIFKHFELYKDLSKEPYRGKNKTRFGINTVDDKAAFFDNWHVHFGDWGENYGRNLASGEDTYILDQLLENAQEINKSEFEDKIRALGDIKDTILLSTGLALMDFFENNKAYIPNWHRDAKPLNVKGFSGWFKLGNELIPVFKVFYRKREKQILILNKKKLGAFIRKSPLNAGEDPNLQRDIFYMDVRAFSENESLLNEFLAKPPEWLKKIGSKDDQSAYLKERVLIKIFSRPSFEKQNNFEAYRFEK